MAMRNMMESDCGGENPLMKLGSHFTQDQAFRQERVNTLPPQFGDAECLVNDFLEDSMGQNMQTFRMDTLASEIRNIDMFNARNPINQAPNVAELAYRETDVLWSEELLRAEKMGGASAVMPDPLELRETDRDAGFVRAVTNPRTALMASSWASEFTGISAPPTADMWVENFMANRQDELGISNLADGLVEPESKFQKFWQRAEEETVVEQNASADKLLNDVYLEGYGTEDNEASSDNVESQEFWDKMQKMWQQLRGEKDTESERWQDEFTAFVDPFQEYKFETENPMAQSEDAFNEGLKKLEEQDLPSAVLCFEAAAQADPENALIWQYLGTTQAENEQDPYAIAALKKCLNLQPDNLTALMALAISYTNENYQNQACQMLRDWLQHNPKYRDLCATPCTFNKMSTILDNGFHGEVKELFIKAANRTPMGGIDVDVQCALGVLFNLSSEFDMATDCFKAALQASPKDFRMWNRLGASLANGQRSAEAVDAYRKALELSPGFIRARYNLGISCINLNAHREAAEHLLTGLSQQANGTTSRGDRGGMSESIWSTLRLVVGLIGNPDHVLAVESRDLNSLKQAFSIK